MHFRGSLNGEIGERAGSSGHGIQATSSPASGGELVASALPQSRGLSIAVCAGVQEMDMSLSRLTWSSRTLIRAIWTLVGHGFDGAGGKELYTMAAVRYEIVAWSGGIDLRQFRMQARAW